MQRCKKNCYMANVKESWGRLSQIIEASGLTIHAFALAIGLTRSETLYQIKRGQIGISRNVAEAVVNRFPEYNKMWLLTGLGSMYSETSSTVQNIPYYSCELSRISEIDSITPMGYMFMPQVGLADFAICYHGEDMSPSVPNGTVIILRETEVDKVIFGREYVVEFNGMVLLRKIRKGTDETLFRLVAQASSSYDEVVVSCSDIEKLYVVKAKLIIQN